MTRIDNAHKHPLPAAHNNQSQHDNARNSTSTPAAQNAPLPVNGNIAESFAVKKGIDAGFSRQNLNNKLLAKSGSGAPPFETYLPPRVRTQRNQGRSANVYDKGPIADRPRGDLDRYRAVNPEIVSQIKVKRNGKPENHFLYPANLKSDAHFFDKNLNNKGVAQDSTVKIDFARSKTKDGVKYVYAYDKNATGEIVPKGYVRLGALKETRKDVINGAAFRFPLNETAKQNGVTVVDGSGESLGTLRGTGNGAAGDNRSTGVKLNFGQERTINGVKHYYLFADNLKGSGKGVSGWIAETALKVVPKPPNAEEKRNLAARIPPGNTTAYEITGGNPADFQYKINGRTFDYKVLPGVSKDERVAANDYIKRGSGAINLGANVAGVSNDTFKIPDPFNGFPNLSDGLRNAPEKLVFHRSNAKGTTVEIPLYYAKGDGSKRTDDQTPVAGKRMKFAYGYIETVRKNHANQPILDQNGKPIVDKKWGWLAIAALKRT